MNTYMISQGQTVFARWKDGYYYPAVVDEVKECAVKVSFLDGYVGLVPSGHIVELQEAFQTMQLQGNWQNHGIFFKGVLESQESMTMYYDDGDVEQVELKQLRGAKLQEPIFWKQTACLFFAGLAAGMALCWIRKIMKR